MIVCSDCLKILNSLEDNCINLTVTSPPYDNLRDYEGYDFDFENIAKELYRVTDKGGVVVWIVGDATIDGSETGTSFRQALYFKKVGFNLHDTMIWNKNVLRYPEANRYYSVFEYMFIFSKGRPCAHNLIADKKNVYAGDKVARRSQKRLASGELLPNSAFRIDPNRVIKDYGVRFNIWNIPTSSQSGDKIALSHPATFPERLANDHIITWSNEGDIILDPMCGSGTVLKMADINNRSFIGIDISEKYCELSLKRVNANREKLGRDLLSEVIYIK